jgi:iron complex outermembrane receptor protein
MIGAGLVACSLAMPAAQAQMSGVLEEIIVTAQKREENIQEVPIAITRMSGDRLNARFTGGEDILALASAAPGLYVETSNGRIAPRFYMRGLGNADFTQAASQPVSIVFDDVVMEKVALKSFPLFDMDRIEIIRGPQGTLFGRNTTAGIVKVDTRRPTEETEGYVKASAGNYGIFNVEGAVGGTLVENTLMARVSVLSQNMSDWVDNGFTGENDFTGGQNIFAGRLQFLWTPSDTFTVWFMHQRQDQDATSSLFRANVFNQGSNNLNTNYDRDTVYWDGGGGNPAKIKSHGTTLKLDWDLDNFTITSITSYQDVYDRSARGDIDGGYGCVFTCGDGPAGPPSSPFSPFTSPFVVNVDTGSDILMDQFTQELRLASNFDGPLNYQVGYFYFDDEFNGDAQNQSAGATEYTTGSTSNITNTAWSVFGQGSYDFSDQLTMSLGVRYTDDEKDALHVRFVDGVPEPLAPISLSDDNVSWDLALSYDLSDNQQVYGRAASGFRAQTIQDRLEDDPDVTTADSETIMSYEVGFKTVTDTFRFNAAAFYYVVDDMQLTAVGGADNSTRLLNAKEGIGYGIELEIDYVVSENLVLSGGYGLNKTEINEPGLSTATCGSGLCTVLDPLDANDFAIIDGNPFQHAPAWTLNFEIDYRRPLASGSELYLFTDWKFRGETNDFLYENIEFTYDTQFEGGLRFGYRNIDRNYEIGFFGRNITDEDNPLGGIDFANNTGYVNQPRIYGVEASYSF